MKADQAYGFFLGCESIEAGCAVGRHGNSAHNQSPFLEEVTVPSDKLTGY